MSRMLLTRFVPLTTLTFVVHQYGLVPPLVGGTFECDDASIGHTSEGDTISLRLLLLLVTLPTLATMQWTEMRELDGSVEARKKLFKSAWHKTWPQFVHFLNYSALSLLINELVKAIVAWPRPHFLHTCNPDLSALQCHRGPVMFEPSLCRGQDVWVDGFLRPISDSMRSFPSGHSQLAVFNAVFVIMYLRCRESGRSGFSLMLQLCFLLMATFVCISRVVDKRHHWRDVGVGSSVGAISASIIVRLHASQFGQREKNE